MEKAYKAGKVRAIGLSNFNKAQIEELLSLCEVNPTVLQTELHPYHQEPEMKLRNSLTAIGPIPDTIVIGKNKPGAEAVELY